MHIKNLCYRHHKQAPYFFKDLSFHLEPGKFHALHGKNGVGKSVLMNILSDHIPRDAILNGEIERNDRVVLVNQRFDWMIADQFTFKENLQFALLGRFPRPILPLNEASCYVDLLKHFHIDISTPVHKLSGGQRQILALLMVLQRKVNYLLLDEPTAALDEQNAHLVFDFLQAISGLTLLVICHDRELVSHYVTGKHFHLEMDNKGLRYIQVHQPKHFFNAETQRRRENAEVAASKTQTFLRKQKGFELATD